MRLRKACYALSALVAGGAIAAALVPDVSGATTWSSISFEGPSSTRYLNIQVTNTGKGLEATIHAALATGVPNNSCGSGTKGSVSMASNTSNEPYSIVVTFFGTVACAIIPTGDIRTKFFWEDSHDRWHKWDEWHLCHHLWKIVCGFHREGRRHAQFHGAVSVDISIVSGNSEHDGTSTVRTFGVDTFRRLLEYNPVAMRREHRCPCRVPGTRQRGRYFDTGACRFVEPRMSRGGGRKFR